MGRGGTLTIREGTLQRESSRAGAVPGADQALTGHAGQVPQGGGIPGTQRILGPAFLLPWGLQYLYPRMLSSTFYTSPQPCASLSASITPCQKPILEPKAILQFFPPNWTQPPPGLQPESQVLYLGSLPFPSEMKLPPCSLPSLVPFSQLGMTATDYISLCLGRARQGRTRNPVLNIVD